MKTRSNHLLWYSVKHLHAIIPCTSSLWHDALCTVLMATLQSSNTPPASALTGGTCEIVSLPFFAPWPDAFTLLYLCAVHLVDIWNVIEALRENALNNLDPNTELNVARLEAVLSTIFYQLNKRMPTTHQIHVEQSIGLLLNFLLAAFDPWVPSEWRLRCTCSSCTFLVFIADNFLEQPTASFVLIRYLFQ